MVGKIEIKSYVSLQLEVEIKAEHGKIVPKGGRKSVLESVHRYDEKVSRVSKQQKKA